jgi:hypothetical protein
MSKPPEQLEKELQAIWLNAANTRKGTAPRRIETILESSRAELSLRDLFIFFTYLGRAFFMLLCAVLPALLNPPAPADQSRDTNQ